MPPLRIALTIAGSDPSGGAGLQADLKTFHQFGVYGQAVVTLVTVQNTRTVSRVELLPPDLVREQLEAVGADLPPHAAKTGALGSAELVRTIATLAAEFTFPLVVDPVMISKHGVPLMSSDARAALQRDLLPRAFLVTPNTHEAAALTGHEVRTREEAQAAARVLQTFGARNVLVKGGHLEGDAADVLLLQSGECQVFSAPRVDTPHTHGTGCTYSAAITALLARGAALPDAVRRGKQFIAEAIRTNPGLGGGQGPVNHFARRGVE
jgi:hydroxymethylpyrimidine/phosphomethylpyrimidine kinase